MENWEMSHTYVIGIGLHYADTAYFHLKCRKSKYMYVRTYTQHTCGRSLCIEVY